jgi:hypothetical protein
MNEISNGFGAMPDGFSAVSMGELDQIEGGQTSMGPYKPYVDGTADSYWRLVRWLSDQK